MINCGIEIEFNTNNLEAIKTALSKIVYEVKYENETVKSNAEYVYIKNEQSIKGYEVTIPPICSEEILEYILYTLNEYADCSHPRSAIHIHIAVNENQLETIKANYLAHQDEIIQEAVDNGVYVNLNYKVVPQYDRVFQNLNITKSFKEHGTIEHRIYKSTFDYNKIMFMINQTKRLV